MKTVIEIYSDKARLLVSERRPTSSGKSEYDHIVFIGEAYANQIALLKREAKKATGHTVEKNAEIKRFDRPIYLTRF